MDKIIGEYRELVIFGCQTKQEAELYLMNYLATQEPNWRAISFTGDQAELGIFRVNIYRELNRAP